MNLNNIFRLANNFFYAHTWLTIGIVAGILLIVWWRPKQTLKIMLVILAAGVVGYVLYYLGQATLSGMGGKEQMINK